MKLFIKLDGFTKTKGDRIEVEITDISQIKAFYAGLEKTFGTPTSAPKTNSDRKQFAGLNLSEKQIYRLTKIQGYTEADLKGVTYDTLGKFMENKKVKTGQISAKPQSGEANEVNQPWSQDY